MRKRRRKAWKLAKTYVEIPTCTLSMRCKLLAPLLRSDPGWSEILRPGLNCVLEGHNHQARLRKKKKNSPKNVNLHLLDSDRQRWWTSDLPLESENHYIIESRRIKSFMCSLEKHLTSCWPTVLSQLTCPQTSQFRRRGVTPQLSK